MLTIFSSSFGQINADFLKKEKTYQLTNYSEQLPDISMLDQDIRLTSPSFTSGNSVLCAENGILSVNNTWMGQETQTTFNFYNIPIQTNFQFDIQGRFQSSSMSISLTRD